MGMVQTSSMSPAQRQSDSTFKTTVRAKEIDLLNLTSFGPWAKGHIEWDNGCLSSI